MGFGIAMKNCGMRDSSREKGPPRPSRPCLLSPLSERIKMFNPHFAHVMISLNYLFKTSAHTH